MNLGIDEIVKKRREAEREGRRVVRRGGRRARRVGEKHTAGGVAVRLFSGGLAGEEGKVGFGEGRGEGEGGAEGDEG